MRRPFLRQRWLTPPKALLLGFTALIALGATLLRLPAAAADGRPLEWVDALFTAVSAVCITGLTVVETGTRFSPFGHVLILVMMQVGGVGFVTMAVVISVLLGRRVNLRERLILQEALGQVKVQGVVLLGLRILALTTALEAVGAALLWVRWQAELGPGRAAWFAVFHSVSAFVNAGFDLFGAVGQSSLHAYRADVLVNVVVGSLIILGSLGMPVLLEVAQYRRGRRLSLHASLVLTMSGLLLALGAALLLVTESEAHSAMGSLPWGERLLAAGFQSLSARSGGLSTVPLAQMSGAGWLVLMALMFAGGATASMGGGIKVNVLGALLATLWSVARGQEDVQVFERTIPRETIYKALGVMFGGATVVMIMTILLYLAERGETLHLLFEIVSAFGTVGYSLGASPELTPAGKLIVAATMFLGRLGPLTLMAALARPLTPPLLGYPEEKILIG